MWHLPSVHTDSMNILQFLSVKVKTSCYHLKHRSEYQRCLCPVSRAWSLLGGGDVTAGTPLSPGRITWEISQSSSFTHFSDVSPVLIASVPFRFFRWDSSSSLRSLSKTFSSCFLTGGQISKFELAQHGMVQYQRLEYWEPRIASSSHLTCSKLAIPLQCQQSVSTHDHGRYGLSEDTEQEHFILHCIKINRI